MKIAAVSDDGVTISQHFGRAAQYVVLALENEMVAGRQVRAKMGHVHFANEPHVEGADPRGHGFDPAAQSRHTQMASPISDCGVLLARGMGRGASESLAALGIRVIMTDIAQIDEAVKAYLAGTIVDHVERLH